MKKIRFIKSSGTFIEKEIKNYFEQPLQQFIEMFLPEDEEYVEVDEKEDADICFYSIQLEDEDLLRKNEKNVFFSIENFSGWSHYKHMQKFGKYGCKKTDIYISNDESEIKYVGNMKVIPTVLCRINYFNKIERTKILKQEIPFSKKMFLLITSRNMHNTNKMDLIEKLKKYGIVHHISMYDSIIKNKSCYHSSELINVYNKYKFVMSFENTHSPGYITEKIFNVFLAKSIPIYDGAPNIDKYINKSSYIQYDKQIENKISIVNNEKMYNAIVEKNKINEEYKNIKIDYSLK